MDPATGSNVKFTKSKSKSIQVFHESESELSVTVTDTACVPHTSSSHSYGTVTSDSEGDGLPEDQMLLISQNLHIRPKVPWPAPLTGKIKCVKTNRS